MNYLDRHQIKNKLRCLKLWLFEYQMKVLLRIQLLDRLQTNKLFIVDTTQILKQDARSFIFV